MAQQTETENGEIISFYRTAIKQWHWLVIPLNSHEKHIHQQRNQRENIIFGEKYE